MLRWVEIGVPFSRSTGRWPNYPKCNRCVHLKWNYPNNLFRTTRRIRENTPTIPIGLLVYANLVLRMVVENFYIRLKSRCWFCISCRCPYVWIKETISRSSIALHNILHPFLFAHQMLMMLLQQIGKYSYKGYTYLLSRAGRDRYWKRAEMPLTHLLSQLNQYKAAPALQDFWNIRTWASRRSD